MGISAYMHEATEMVSSAPQEHVLRLGEFRAAHALCRASSSQQTETES
jgi:hypothetical protein